MGAKNTMNHRSLRYLNEMELGRWYDRIETICAGHSQRRVLKTKNAVQELVAELSRRAAQRLGILVPQQ